MQGKRKIHIVISQEGQRDDNNKCETLVSLV
jgi:hypothetical protein